MELLQVVRRPEDDGRVRAGLVGQEEVVGLGPAVPDRPRVGEGDPRHLAVDPEGGGRPARRELVVVGDVVPPVGEVRAGERRPVRPAMPLPEVEGEAPAALGDLDPLGDVGHEAVVSVEAHQPGVAVHEGQLRVLQGADQHPEIAPVDRRGLRGQDARPLREPLGERRELARGYELGERGRLPAGSAGSSDGEDRRRDAEREHEPDPEPAAADPHGDPPGGTGGDSRPVRAVSPRGSVARGPGGTQDNARRHARAGRAW